MTLFFQNITNNIFGLSSNEANNLISNISNLKRGENDVVYELEIRFTDNKRRSANLETYNSLDLSEAVELGYTDIVYISYNSQIDNIHIRSNNGTITEKTNICSVETKNISDIYEPELNKDGIIPVVMKFNIEKTMRITEENEKLLLNNRDVFNYQRRQRISYRINKPYLRNWRIDKTIRLLARESQHKKLHCFLEKSNVSNPDLYDYLDIEFEYIGDFSEIDISLCKLFEYLYPKKYQIFNREYNIINNYIHRHHNLYLNRLSSSVDIITNNFIANENILDYVYEEKIDGERVMIVIYTSYSYSEHKTKITETTDIFELTKDSFKLINSVINQKLTTENEKGNDKITNGNLNGNQQLTNCYLNKVSIVDTERIIKNDKPLYILFDCLMVNNKYYNELSYIDRIKKCGDFVKLFGEYIDCKIIKCYQITLKDNSIETYKNKIDKLITIVNTRFTSSIPGLEDVDIDGLVLHKINTTFVNSKSYKLKNSFMMTIDFKLIYVEDKHLYYLYLIGDAQDLIRIKPIINRYSKTHFGYSVIERPKGAYMLFDSPFIPNAYEYNPNLDWFVISSKDNEFITEKIMKHINENIEKMIEHPKDFNNVIVEMALYEKSKGNFSWLPLRIRKDKLYSNGYKVGLSISEYLYNKLSTRYYKSGVSNNLINYDERLRYVYQFLTEKYLQRLNYNKLKNTIDEENDIIINTSHYNQITTLLKYLKINNLYVIAPDKIILTNTCDEIYKGSNRIYTNIFNESKIYFNNPNVSCVFYNTDKKDFTNDIRTKLLKTCYIPCSIAFYIDDNVNCLYGDEKQPLYNFTGKNDTLEEYINKAISTLNRNGYYITVSKTKLNEEIITELIKYTTKEVINEEIKSYYINIFRIK